MTAATHSKEPPGISLPLYGGGLAVTLCGVLAVCSSMGVADITASTLVLTVLGFGFSLACRYLKIEPRVIEIACGALIAYIAYGLLSQHPVFGQDLSWYVRGADKTEDRLAAGLMWSAVLWSWTLVSSESVMFACVLTAAMIGLTGSADVNNSTLVYFCLFVLAMAFLLIHQNYLHNRAQAAPAQRGGLARAVRTQVGLAGVCAVLGLCAGLVVVVPMRAALSSLSLSQAIRQLVGSSRISEASLTSERFSDDMGLEIGRGSVWPTSSAVVMHARPSDGLPHYWRGRTYDLYTGAGWQSTRQNARPLDWQEATDDGRIYPITGAWVIGEGLPSVRRPRMTATMEVTGDTDQFYYADEPRSLLFDSQNGPEPHLSADGSLDLDGHSIRSAYAVSSAVPPDATQPPIQARLRQAGVIYPPLVRRLYLKPLENNITTDNDRAYYRLAVHQALRALPLNRRAPIDQALAIQNWITAQCTYSLSVDPLPPGVDHVHAFLANTRRGYCDLFASSMVVLCRTAGLPARLATGFAPGEADDSGTSYDIRALDKHAWAEVYFPGNGWLIFDPTIGTRTDGSIPSQAVPRQGLWQRARRLLLNNGPLPLALAVAIVLCLGYVGAVELSGRLRGRRVPRSGRTAAAHPARTDLGRQYARMTHSLAAIGLPRHPAETPAEYEARLVPLLARQEATLGIALPAAPIHALTAQFVAARYGGSLGGDTRLAAQCARQVAEATARARRARWLRALRGIKG